MLHKLLKDQIKNYLGPSENLPLEIQNFFHIVSDSYQQYENNVHKLEQTANINSSEILEINTRLQDEASELRQAHNELGRIFNSVNLGFFSRNTITNSYIYLSAGCKFIYGYPVNEFYNNNLLWYNLIYPDDRSLVSADDEKLARGEHLLTHYRIIHKDGSVRWLELKIIPHFSNGILARVDGVVNDISARKQVEAERESMINELMKSNTDLKQFSFITSHNLRAPLSNILGILNILDFPEPNTHNGQLLTLLKAAADQLNKTINDLTKILIIKNSNPDLVVLNLDEAFNDVNKTFVTALEEAGGSIKTDFQSRFITINKVYLESIFVNLLSNAIRYRAPGRPLNIVVRSSEDAAGNVVMKFTDNGTGIDLIRHKDRVFGLYQRFHDKIEGHGLGLFIMKSQIEATGGTIQIESSPNEGTSFIITFKKQQPVTDWVAKS